MQIHFEPTDLPKDDIHVVVQARQLTPEVAKLMQYIENWQQNHDLLPVTVADRIVLLTTKEIIALEVLGNDLTIYTMQETYYTKGGLKKILKRLPDDFIQVSKNSAINLNHLQSMEAAFSGSMTAFLTKKIKISVSRNYLPQLKAALGM